MLFSKSLVDSFPLAEGVPDTLTENVSLLDFEIFSPPLNSA